MVLDKFFVTFPWMGMETHIGGISVDVSRGWDIDDNGIAKRAAGFTRSSISAAMLLPTLALIIALRMRSYVLRMLMLFATVGAVFMTTQKGAVVAIAVVTLILATPGFMRYRLLCWAAIGFAVLDVTLPIFTSGLLVADNGGVFSFASFAMRITDTWPDAWRWISDNNLFPFGVGLGGIGGAQRFYAQDFFNPSDNLFIFIYANFGVLSLFYLGWMLWQGIAPAARHACWSRSRHWPFWCSTSAMARPCRCSRIRFRNCILAPPSECCGCCGRWPMRNPGPTRSGARRSAIGGPALTYNPQAAGARGGTAMKIRTEDETNNFTLLRLLLSLAVVLGHFKLLSGTQYPPFPFNLADAAVDCFFVVSGFLIALSYARTHGLWSFYVRRFFRLYPMYACIVLIQAGDHAVACCRADRSASRMRPCVISPST